MVRLDDYFGLGYDDDWQNLYMTTPKIFTQKLEEPCVLDITLRLELDHEFICNAAMAKLYYDHN